MKNASSKQNRINRIATRTQRSLLPLVAVGGSLASLPASALELGDLTVQSRLGQPLRASIAYALAPNERLADSCISLGAGAAASGLPGIGRATISVSDSVIRLTGKTPVREPMVAAQVAIDCPYTANLTREYMLFIDPADPAFAEQPVVQTTSATPAVTARQSTPVATPPAPAKRTVSQEPIGNSTRYLVQPGDDLGSIASRIQNRSISLWPAANAIFDANPDAFIDNDPNKLKAGSWLTIPSLDGSAPVLSMATSTNSAPVENVTTNVPDTSELGASELEIDTAAEVTPVEAVETAPVEIDRAISDTTSDLSAENAELDFYDPFVDAVDATNENIVIPDTELEGPTTTSSSPNVPTAIINTSTGESSSSWLMWLAGSGIVMIIGLLLFGRRFTGRIDAPVPDHPMRRATDDETGTTESIASDFFDLEDDAPTEENLSLDADLFVGTGLEDATDVDMDVAQDFGFAAPTDVDIELPFEPEPTIETAHVGTAEESILDSEILPADDDDDYDLSVIVDATKMPQPEDVTELDLKAIEVESANDSSTTDSYTINDEVDLEILEQDYEDEFTATQALNKEIARAALAGGPEGADDETTDLPLASIDDLDVTSLLPSQDEYVISSDADTGVHEAATVEMPAADNDETSEMEIDGGAVDTKAS